MIKFTNDLMREAHELFPAMHELHNMMKRGDAKALDMVYNKLGFTIDEDDIVRAFRNKKEMSLLDAAKKAQQIRSFYQKMFTHIDKQEMKQAAKMQYEDCV